MSSYAYNPFTSNLDLVGSGASYIDGVVATPASLPVTLNTPPLDAVFLAKAGSGVWLISRRPAGLYCRVANNGNANDWVHLGAFPEVNSSANWELYDGTDPTKELKFNLANITTGTTRTLTVPNASGTIALLETLPAGGDTVSIEASAADVLSVSSGAISAVDATADKIVFYDDSASELTYLELGSGLSITDQTLSATASGGSKTYAVFSAEHNQPPATAFATLDTRNSIAVLDFDAATDESAVFVGIMPEAASLGSGLIVRLHWMATSATSGNVRWGVQFERSNTDLDADSFDTAVEATAAANGTSGILTTTAITVTTIDGITAGDVFRLKVFRNADDATNDTMTGDAELVAVEIRSAA